MASDRHPSPIAMGEGLGMRVSAASHQIPDLAYLLLSVAEPGDVLAAGELRSFRNAVASSLLASLEYHLMYLH